MNSKKRKKHKRRRIWRAILSVTAALIVLAAVAVLLFRTKSYEVKGNSYYGEDTITSWIQNDRFSVNTLYILAKYNFTEADLPSGVESIRISLKNPWTVRVTVKEKELAGYVDYDGAYLFFDREGTATIKTKKCSREPPISKDWHSTPRKWRSGKSFPWRTTAFLTRLWKCPEA